MKKNYETLNWRPRQFFAKMLTSVAILGASVAVAQITPTVYVPATGSSSIALCSGSFVVQDHGGNGNYANSVDGNYVFYAGVGGTITIVGTYTVENNFDFINIYNGVGTGTQLAQYTNNSSLSFTNTPGQTLTLRFRSDASVPQAGFQFTVTYTGPCYFPSCTSSPGTNTVLTTNSNICPWSANPVLSLANSYTASGIYYSFLASTTGSLGPYTTIPNTSGNYYFSQIAYTANPLPVQTTWYQAVMTCTFGGLSTTATPVEVVVGGSVVSTVPYLESFEGIQVNKDLPNCSWARTDNYQAGSRTAMVTAWRQARTGAKFAEFDASAGATNLTQHFYSNGISLVAGITYSASVWYNTSGTATWNNLQLMYGPNQSTTGLVSLATIQTPNNANYQSLSNTFTIGTSGIYYLAVRATGNSASQLVWDDLALIAPCQFTTNTPNFVVNGPSSVCSGQAITLNASGNTTYSWSTGATTNSIQVSPIQNSTYTVSGVNPVTGCFGSTVRSILVNPSPLITIVPLKQQVCAGESVMLIATGATSYTWSANATIGSAITVTPTTANNSYTVMGSNFYGCTTSAVQQIGVNALPIISVSGPTIICIGGSTQLSATGAGTGGTYQWFSSVINLGANVTLSPIVSTIYTAKGTDANGCVGEKDVVVAVDPCVGISAIDGSGTTISVFPNPNTGLFNIKSVDGINKEIEVVDVMGRLVFSTATSAGITEININTLSSGVYYVKVTTGNFLEVVKIIKD